LNAIVQLGRAAGKEEETARHS